MAKKEHIHIRISEDDKKKIEKAASKERRTISEFMIFASLERVEKITKKNDSQ